MIGLTSRPSVTHTHTHTHIREEYAKPLHSALFFAGEGTNVAHPACVDGAFATGTRAAAEAVRAMLSSLGGNGNGGRRA